MINIKLVVTLDTDVLSSDVGGVEAASGNNFNCFLELPRTVSTPGLCTDFGVNGESIPLLVETAPADKKDKAEVFVWLENSQKLSVFE